MPSTTYPGGIRSPAWLQQYILRNTVEALASAPPSAGSVYMFDRVKEFCSSPGVGIVNLLGLPAGFAGQTFSRRIPTGGSTPYTIVDQGGPNWETGLGTYNQSGNYLVRNTVLDGTNGPGVLVNFSSGNQNVFCDLPATAVAPANTNYNVKMFGAKGDAIGGDDATFTSGSSTLNSAHASFVQADVGKLLWIQGGGPTRTVADGATTINTGTLTSATANFSTSDVGSFVNVAGAGPSGGVLNSQIAAWISATQVQMNAHATASVSGASTTISGNLLTTITAVNGQTSINIAATFQFTTSPQLGPQGAAVRFWYATQDDTVPIKAAIAAAAAVGGTVYLPGNYLITSTLILPSQLAFIGRGNDAYLSVYGAQAVFKTGTALVWCGPPGGTMILVQPQQVTLEVIGLVVKDMAIHGNIVAGTGMRIEAAAECIFDNIFISQTTFRGMDWNSCFFPGFTGVNQTTNCIARAIWMYPSANGDGLYMGGIPTTTTDVDPTVSTFEHIYVLHENGIGFNLAYVDTCRFLFLRASRVAGGTGIGIQLGGSANGRDYCNNNFFGSINAGPGGLTSRATGLNRAAQNNAIDNYELLGNPPLPTVEDGSGIVYRAADGTIFDSSVKAGTYFFTGNAGFNQPAATSTVHILGGGSRVQAIATPAAPTVALGGGSGTGTNYTYWIIAEDTNGFRSLASAPTTFSGPASVTTANWIKITWTQVAGAIKYYVLKNTSATLTANTLLSLTGTYVGSLGSSGGHVTGINIINGGTGYTNGTFTDGTFSNGITGAGSAGTFAYTISGGTVTNIAILNGGTGYLGAVAVLGASAGSGTGFSAIGLVAKCSSNGGTNLEADDTGQAFASTIVVPVRNATADSIVDGQQNIYYNLSTHILTSGTIFTATATAVSNTASTTVTLISATGIGTKTLPANFFQQGGTIKLRVKGFYTSTVTSNTTLTFLVKLGATTICTSAALNPVAAVTSGYFEGECDITCRTTGTSGTVFGQGSVILYNTTNVVNGVWGMPATATATIDTTATQVIDFQCTQSAGTNAQTLNATNGEIELIQAV